MEGKKPTIGRREAFEGVDNSTHTQHNNNNMTRTNKHSSHERMYRHKSYVYVFHISCILNPDIKVVD